MLVQQQLNAYNAHDLEAFLAPYADDVDIYSLPGEIISAGKEEMRNNYMFLTNTPNIYCKLLNRITDSNMVVDHEEIWGFPGGPVHGIAIYVIEDGKISKVFFNR